MALIVVRNRPDGTCEVYRCLDIPFDADDEMEAYQIASVLQQEGDELVTIEEAA